MTKRIRAKHKIDRRLGQNIWGRSKSPLNKRETRPGQHGERRAGKLSDYGQQLRAKQKLKGYYANVSEKPVPPHLSGSSPREGFDLRTADRPAWSAVSTLSSIAPSLCRPCSRPARSSAMVTSR